MKYSLHNHCYRCGHATGKEEAYVLQAIESGIQTFGMSEHVPYPEGFRIRMPFSQLDDYLDTLMFLKKKYDDKIQILAGFECEYDVDRLDLYCQYIQDQRVDYLILGHHYPSGEDPDTYFAFINDDDHLEQYVQGLEHGIASGLFLFIAHPDLFLAGIQTLEKKHIDVITRICIQASKYNVPLEFNANGIRRGYFEFEDGTRFMYPDLRFWEIVKLHNVDVVISSDAHTVEHVLDDAVNAAFEYCNRLGLNVISDVNILFRK